MTHVLTVTLAAHSDTTVEVHMLNPGEHFERFGGSSRGLTVVGKTASLITRTKSPGGTEDVESRRLRSEVLGMDVADDQRAWRIRGGRTNEEELTHHSAACYQGKVQTWSLRDGGNHDAGWSKPPKRRGPRGPFFVTRI